MAKENKEFRHIVRVANTDLDGSKPIYHALTKIKGVSVMLANAACTITGVEKNQNTGTISDVDVKKLDKFFADPLAQGCPVWLCNRRHDMETGADRHLLGSDLTFQKENDIKLMRKIKSYKGLRHAVGLTVRGQKTKNNFRKKKGKASLGVKRKK
jgi:small subunit ribosomal protein S13